MIRILYALREIFLKSFSFSGFASLYLFRVWTIALILINAPLFFFLKSLAKEDLKLALPFVLIYCLLLLPATVSLTVRRLHEIGNSGRLICLAAVAGFGALFLTLYCFLMPSSKASFRFDPPKYDYYL